MGRPSRSPTAIQAALRRRRAGDAWLGRGSKVWMRSNRMPWSIRRGTTRLTGVALNSPHDKSADKRQRLETKPISRGTERCYGAGGDDVATSSLELNRWSAAMPQPNDLSRSLVALD